MDVSASVGPVRVFPQDDSPASSLCAAAVRPVAGVLFRGPPTEEPVPEGRWSSGTNSYYGLPLRLGLFEPPTPSARFPAGLLVGRMERRAWFNGVRGEPELTTFLLDIGLEPARIDISDLEVTLDEWVEEELVYSRRVRLEEVPIDHARDEPAVQVRVPALGPRVRRAARLHHRDGTLLDRTSRFHVVESVEVSISTLPRDGAMPRPRSRAPVPPPPRPFDDVLAATRHVENDRPGPLTCPRRLLACTVGGMVGRGTASARVHRVHVSLRCGTTPAGSLLSPSAGQSRGPPSRPQRAARRGKSGRDRPRGGSREEALAHPVGRTGDAGQPRG